jgi:hypothetical protein
MAFDRYLRARVRHPHAHLPKLGLSERGAFTKAGLRLMLERRAKAASLGHIHPYQFRHTFAHEWLSAGATRVTSCASPADASARRAAATPPLLPTNVPARPTAAWHQTVATDHALPSPEVRPPIAPFGRCPRGCVGTVQTTV